MGEAARRDDALVVAVAVAAIGSLARLVRIGARGGNREGPRLTAVIRGRAGVAGPASARVARGVVVADPDPPARLVDRHARHELVGVGAALLRIDPSACEPADPIEAGVIDGDEGILALPGGAEAHVDATGEGAARSIDRDRRRRGDAAVGLRADLDVEA